MIASPAAAQMPMQATFEEAIAAFNYGDNDLAFKQFYRLANDGDSRAQYYLAYMMDSALGTGKDLAGAAQWYRKSAQQDYLPAIVYMGYIHSSAHGVPRDDKEAFKWYTRAAQMGDAIAQNNLATMLLRGVPYAKNEPLAAQWFLQSAMQGNMRAQYNLATMYRLGQGIKKNGPEALRWYSFAANQGDMYAQNALGYMYRKGEGTEKDPAEAIEWYRRAAEQGHVRSQMAIAIMYELGEAGADKGLDDATVWYFNAANQGNERAMHRLGYLYERGRECIDVKPCDEKKSGQGLARDEKEAFRWYKKAVDERNHAPSITALAGFYEQGKGGVKPDLRKAVEFYIKAAGVKDPLAMMELGRLYKEGKADFNGKEDRVRAYQWYTLAQRELSDRMKSGKGTIADEEMMAGALKQITAMNVNMDSNDRQNAMRLVNSWRPFGSGYVYKPPGKQNDVFEYDSIEEDAQKKK